MPRVRALAVLPVAAVAAVASWLALGRGDAVAPAPGGAAVRLLRGPWLTGARTDGVTVHWTTREPTDSVVEVHPFASSEERSARDEPTSPSREVIRAGDPAARETRHRVSVTGLAPGTACSYRIVTTAGGGGQVGPAATFTTAPVASESTVTFVALGDSGTGSSAQADVARLLRDESFEFLVHTGDVVYPAGEEPGYDASFFPQYAATIASHPIFGAVGNHDLLTPGAKPYVDVFDPPRNNPEGSPLYYSFRWGDAKLVSIDSTGLFQNPGPWGAWLERELAGERRRWLVVLMHAPLYCCDRGHGDDETLQALWQPLLERHRVDLVVAGHSHMYQRTPKIKRSSTDPTYAGFTEIVTGGGGASLYPVDGRTAVPPAFKESVHHYTKITLTKDALLVKMVRSDGSVGESVSIPKD